MMVEEFYAAATSDPRLEHMIADEEDPCKIVVMLVNNLSSDCRQQIHSKAFDEVFNLVLLLLLRYDTCHDVRLCRTTLILVGIVSGHLSGRIGELIDLSEMECDLAHLYSLYREDEA
jgi:hypothetical protein